MRGPGAVGAMRPPGPSARAVVHRLSAGATVYERADRAPVPTGRSPGARCAGRALGPRCVARPRSTGQAPWNTVYGPGHGVRAGSRCAARAHGPWPARTVHGPGAGSSAGPMPHGLGAGAKMQRRARGPRGGRPDQGVRVECRGHGPWGWSRGRGARGGPAERRSRRAERPGRGALDGCPTAGRLSRRAAGPALRASAPPRRTGGAGCARSDGRPVRAPGPASGLLRPVPAAPPLPRTPAGHGS